MTTTMIDDLFALHTELATMRFVKSADNPYFKKKYQDYPSLLEQVKPVLLKHNFIWITGPGVNVDNGGEPTLVYALKHKSGENASSGVMLLSAKGVTPQDQGSAITYARRYALTAVLDIAADEDDDGNKATDAAKATVKTAEDTAKPITEQTKGNIYLLLKKLPRDPEDFQKFIGKQIDSMSELEGGQAVRRLVTELEKQAASK